MSIFALLIIIILSFLAVRIGGIALEMTGMEPERARFQALSAFTGTGFTTREAESVMNHPQRRKIVSYLMILGNAGIISLIATLVVSIRSDPFRSWIDVGIIVLALLILYGLAASRRLTNRLTEAIRRRLSHTQLVELTLEEILRQQKGYGVARIVIPDCNPLIGMTIAQARFPEHHIVVLSLERDGQLFPVPHSSERLAALDHLVCYGRLEAIQAILGTCDALAPFHVHQEAQ